MHTAARHHRFSAGTWLEFSDLLGSSPAPLHTYCAIDQLKAEDTERKAYTGRGGKSGCSDNWPSSSLK